MYNLIFFIIIMLIIFYIYHNPKNKETFADNLLTITSDQLNVIQNLESHISAIKHLSDVAGSLINGSITIPAGLGVKGDISVNGNSTFKNNSTINGQLDITGISKLNNDVNVNNNILINKTAKFLGNSKFKNLTTKNVSISSSKQIKIGNSILNEDILYDLQNTQTGGLSIQGGYSKNYDFVFSKPFKRIPTVFYALSFRAGTYPKKNDGRNIGWEKVNFVSTTGFSMNAISMGGDSDGGKSWNKRVDLIWIALSKDSNIDVLNTKF